MQELEEKARQLRNEYFKKWRAKNKDKAKKAVKDYWLKKAKTEAERGK